MKPKRIDLEKIDWIGRWLASHGCATAATPYEYHSPYDISATGKTAIDFELKTVTCPSSDIKFNVEANPNWSMDGNLYSKCRGRRCWMLNAKNFDGTPGKFYELINSERGGLIYMFPDCIIMYNKEELKQAAIGVARYKTCHTTQFDSQIVCDEEKVIIDLNKGHRYDVTPPQEFFENKRYMDFNEKNRDSGRPRKR